jgi:hypothetical protein
MQGQLVNELNNGFNPRQSVFENDEETGSCALEQARLWLSSVTMQYPNIKTLPQNISRNTLNFRIAAVRVQRVSPAALRRPSHVAQ